MFLFARKHIHIITVILLLRLEDIKYIKYSTHFEWMVRWIYGVDKWMTTKIYSVLFYTSYLSFSSTGHPGLLLFHSSYVWLSFWGSFIAWFFPSLIYFSCGYLLRGGDTTRNIHRLQRIDWFVSTQTPQTLPLHSYHCFLAGGSLQFCMCYKYIPHSTYSFF